MTKDEAKRAGKKRCWVNTEDNIMIVQRKKFELRLFKLLVFLQ